MCFKIILAVICLMPLFAFSQEICDYSLDFRKKPVFESGELLYSRLDSPDHISGVMKDEGYFHIRYWGCHHIGMNATLFIPDNELVDNLTRNKIEWFSEKILERDDFTKVKELIFSMNFVTGGEKYIESSKYDEFKIEFIRRDGFYVFSLSFYKS